MEVPRVLETSDETSTTFNLEPEKGLEVRRTEGGVGCGTQESGTRGRGGVGSKKVYPSSSQTPTNPKGVRF